MSIEEVQLMTAALAALRTAPELDDRDQFPALKPALAVRRAAATRAPR